MVKYIRTAGSWPTIPTAIPEPTPQPAAKGKASNLKSKIGVLALLILGIGGAVVQFNQPSCRESLAKHDELYRKDLSAGRYDEALTHINNAPFCECWDEESWASSKIFRKEAYEKVYYDFLGKEIEKGNFAYVLAEAKAIRAKHSRSTYVDLGPIYRRVVESSPDVCEQKQAAIAYPTPEGQIQRFITLGKRQRAAGNITEAVRIERVVDILTSIFFLPKTYPTQELYELTKC